jgi:hypothetical protein
LRSIRILHKTSALQSPDFSRGRKAGFVEPPPRGRRASASSLAPERLEAITRWPIMPDRAMILEHLEQARRLVAEGDRHIAHQREIIAEKEHDGHDTSTSKQLLDQFEQICAMYVAERDRLEKELDEAMK